MKNFLTWLKKYLIWIVLVIIIVAGIFIYMKRSGNGTDDLQTLIIQPSDFTQTVSVSGKVTPAKNVELGFNRSGKVISVNAVVGQIVHAGDVMAQIDSGSASLDLENSRVALEKLTKPAEKLDILKDQNALNDALDAKNKAYIDGFNDVDNAFLDLPRIMSGLDTLFNNSVASPYFLDSSLIRNPTARTYRQAALNSYYRAKAAYDKNSIDQRLITRSSASSSIELLIEETYQTAKLTAQALKDANTSVSFVIDQTSNNDRSPAMTTDLANINSWTDQITTDLASLNSIDAALGEADRTIADKKETLAKLINGPEVLDVQAQKLQVQQKELTYQDYFLRAPFDGVVTRLDIKNGEQAIAGQATISMINSGLFQIESFVPEINIANLTVGNPAEATLDAYGSGVKFSANIVSIDPAETIRDGVSTYKVKLQFLAEDTRIKSGMTANLLITALKKPNVLAVPAKAIITNQMQKFVKVIGGNGQIIEQDVTLGKEGALGSTEILSGLKPGDNIVLNP